MLSLYTFAADGDWAGRVLCQMFSDQNARLLRQDADLAAGEWQNAAHGVIMTNY